MTRNQIFDRTARLTGIDGLDAIARANVIIFGLGGVGSWTAETLVRSGVVRLTLVDADCVAPSNINRQLPALVTTVGQVKVDALRAHLLQINPAAEIIAVHGIYDSDTAPGYHLGAYDYVIDCIDSLADKALLILNATQAMAETAGTDNPTVFYSSMGAALKMDPSRIAVAEFWKVKGCPLAAALRRRFKKSGTFPARKFKCVYSDELVPNSPDYRSPDRLVPNSPDYRSSDRPPSLSPSATTGFDEAMTFNKVVTNGSMMHITSIFGITLGSLVIRDILSRLPKSH